MVKRVSTGIDGLDSLVEGGIPEGFDVLVSGTPGTGKTILGLQFIYEGIKKGEPGIYVSFEQFKEEILSQADQFGWNALRNEKLFSLLTIRHKDIHGFLEYLKDEIESKQAKRLVLDSLSVLSVYTNILEDPEHIALMDLSVDTGPRIPLDPAQLHSQTIYHVMGKIKSLGLTTLLITEQSDSTKYTRDEVSEFVCDGLIVLKKVLMGKDTIRSITVEKMRQTNTKAGTHQMDFTPSGIIVK